MAKFRIRKIRAFTVNDNTFIPFRETCQKYERNMSHEMEEFMKRFTRRKK